MSRPAERERGIYTSRIRLELLKAILEKGKLFRFQAPGHSMYPFVRNNDIITIAPLAGRSPRAGDIVAFTHPETENLVVHRVIRCDDSVFLIKGDNTRSPDGLVPRGSIYGRVIRVERDGRNALAGIGCSRGVVALLSGSGILQVFLGIMKLPGKAGRAVMRGAQGSALYRRCARNLRPDLAIVSADNMDMHAVHTLWEAELQPDYGRSAPGVTDLVAKQGTTVIGFIRLVRRSDASHPNPGFWLSALAVRIPYRGMGIGRDLVMRAIQIARDEGAPSVKLLVSGRDRSAIAFFRDLGFEPIPLPGLDVQGESDPAAGIAEPVALHRVFERPERTGMQT